MKPVIRLLIVCVILVQTAFVFAGENATNKPEKALSYQEQVKMFFDKIDRGQFKEALEELYSRNPWASQLQDQLNKLKGQFITLPDMAGAVHSHDLLIEQDLSDRYVLLWYVVSFDRAPLSFRFVFYKPKDSWVIYYFEYQDDLQALAKDMAQYRLVYGKRHTEDEKPNKKALAALLMDIDK